MRVITQLDEENNIYLARVPPGDGPTWTAVVSVFIREILIPIVEERRDKRVAKKEEAIALKNDGAAGASTTEHTPPPRIVFAIDGEREFLRAFNECLAEGPAADMAAAKGMELVKWAAACSNRQQPADVCRSFMILRSLAINDYADEAPDYKDVAAVLLGKIEPASRMAYMNFLQGVPSIFSKAFTIPVIEEGWRVAGIFPPNFDTILERCSGWKFFTVDERLKIRALIPDFAAHVRLNGELDDEFMSAKLLEIGIDTEKWMTEHGARAGSAGPVDHKALGCRRALWVNHERVIANRRAKEEADRQEEERKVAERAAKAERKAARERKSGDQKRKSEEAGPAEQVPKVPRSQKQAEARPKGLVEKFPMSTSGRKRVIPAKFVEAAPLETSNM